MSGINVVEPGHRTSFTVTISSGQTASDWVSIGDCSLVGIEMPSAFDGTQLTIQAKTLAKVDGEASDSDNIQNNGTMKVPTNDENPYTVAADEAHAVTVNCYAGWRIFRVVAGTVQGADRAIVLKARRVGL